MSLTCSGGNRSSRSHWHQTMWILCVQASMLCVLRYGPTIPQDAFRRQMGLGCLYRDRIDYQAPQLGTCNLLKPLRGRAIFLLGGARIGDEPYAASKFSNDCHVGLHASHGGGSTRLDFRMQRRKYRKRRAERSPQTLFSGSLNLEPASKSNCSGLKPIYPLPS